MELHKVEVFRTNVTRKRQAKQLLDILSRQFPLLHINFDLEDCDRILRVKAVSGMVQPSLLIGLLNNFGFYAELLPDDPPMVKNAC